MIIPATPADITTLCALHTACFDRGWGEAEFASFFAHDNIIAAIAYDTQPPNHIPIGFTFAWAVAKECEFLALGVLETYRGNGIGQQLIDYTIKQAKQWQSHTIHLEVRADNNAAIAIYTKNGFTQTGLRKDYYTLANGTKADAITMRWRMSEQAQH